MAPSALAGVDGDVEPLAREVAAAAEEALYFRSRDFETELGKLRQGRRAALTRTGPVVLGHANAIGVALFLYRVERQSSRTR